MLVHGTAIAIDGRSVLLTGPSRSGKSDLALRALTAGAALISDDSVRIALLHGRLFAENPSPCRPMLAIAGIGIVEAERFVERAPLSLTLALDGQFKAEACQPFLSQAGPWHGRFVPQIMLDPFEDSVLAKLHWALLRFGH